jgi:hypothetical protein
MRNPGEEVHREHDRSEIGLERGPASSWQHWVPSSAPTTSGSGGEDSANARAQTEEAIKQLGNAVQDAFEAVGTAAKDEAVRQDVKQVGRSLIGARRRHLPEVSKQLRTVLDGAKGKSPRPGA